MSTQVYMLRTYDRFEAGTVHTFPDGVAQALCRRHQYAARTDREALGSLDYHGEGGLKQLAGRLADQTDHDQPDSQKADDLIDFVLTCLDEETS